MALGITIMVMLTDMDVDKEEEEEDEISALLICIAIATVTVTGRASPTATEGACPRAQTRLSWDTVSLGEPVRNGMSLHPNAK